MQKHVLKMPKYDSFEKLGHRGKIYPVDKITSTSSFVYIETETGLETTILNHECNCFYYVLEGKGYFIIDDIKENFEKNDLLCLKT